MTAKIDGIHITTELQDTQVKSDVAHEKKLCGIADRLTERVRITSHAEYKKNVRIALGRRLGYQPVQEWVRNNVQKLLSVWLLDLTPCHERLRALYSSSPVGSRPYDPQILLRSLLLMAEFGYNSIKAWVAELRSRPLLAIFTGATPGMQPAASTYYDFLERLENGPYQPKCRHVVRASAVRRARSRKLHEAESRPTEEPEHDVEDRRGIIRRFVEETIGQENQPVPRDLAQRLNEMLLELGVKKSLERGLINDARKLTASGDGTAIESAGSPDGKNVCDCRSKGIYHCECERMYSDPDAQWGWDNRHNCYFYGYRLFQLVCADNRHNLPVYLTLAGAKRHEVLQAIECISRMRRDWPEARLARASFDALFDMYPFYKYLCHCKIRYAIPYKKDPANCVYLGDGKTAFTSQGQPLCKGGLPMIYHLTDRQGRHMYHCPIKRVTHLAGRKYAVAVHIEECPLKALCESDSKLGPYAHVSPGVDPRIHPNVPRESDEFTELRNLRSCCERSNSMKKDYYKAEDLNTRVMSYAFIRLSLISILEHSRVWAKQILDPLRKEKRLSTVSDLRSVFT